MAAPVADYRLDDLKLDVDGSRALDVQVGASVKAADLELSIEGASTLTLVVEDPKLALFRSGTFSRWAWGDDPNDVGNDEAWIKRSRAVDVRLKPDLVFRLVRVAKSGTQLTLTFEEREVTYLRRHRGARKAARSKVTRAEFVRMLVREVKAHGGIDLFSPELRVEQPIAKARQRKKTKAEARAGLTIHERLKVKGKPATPGQLRMLDRALDVAASLNPPPKATVALVMAVIQESRAQNLPDGDLDSEGVLQYRVGQVGRKNARDPEWCFHHFMTKGATGRGGAIAVARAHPDWSPSKIIDYVHNPGGGSDYSPWHDEAVKIVRAYGGRIGRGSFTVTKRYEFARGKDETSWDAIGRLAEEVRWRRFMRYGRLWYVSDDWLFRQPVALVVREGAEGVDWIDGDVDLFARRQVAQLTVQARANRWTALPGQVVLVKDTVVFDGRWLVSRVNRSLVDASGAVTITLVKPVPKLPEPAPETEDRTGSGLTTATNGGSAVDLAYEAAVRISRKALPYVWGGGHAKAGKPDGGTGRDPGTGYDCSGYVAACLLAGGMLPKEWEKGVPASGTFASSWGKPGKGRHMTVWANGGHVWIEFHDRKKRADTSPHGSGASGARVRPMNRPTAGFTPRHWPGT